MGKMGTVERGLKVTGFRMPDKNENPSNFEWNHS